MIRLVRDEAGVVTATLVVLLSALFILAGAVVDGGRAIAAHEAATAEAEQAARAGADALRVLSLRGGTIAPGARAAAAAEAYMAETGHPGTASLGGDRVSAKVTPYEIPTTFLGLIGLKAFTVSGHASATAITRYPEGS
jgi:Flp pilus assembly protein TadG